MAAKNSSITVLQATSALPLPWVKSAARRARCLQPEFRTQRHHYATGRLSQRPREAGRVPIGHIRPDGRRGAGIAGVASGQPASRASPAATRWPGNGMLQHEDLAQILALLDSLSFLPPPPGAYQTSRPFAFAGSIRAVSGQTYGYGGFPHDHTIHWLELQIAIMQLAREGPPPPSLAYLRRSCHGIPIR